MASGHAVDHLGRVLPECAWPADRAAPGDLDVIRRFCNTRNCESGADRFETIGGLERWLSDEGMATGTPTESDRARIVAFREHLRCHARAHHEGSSDAELVEDLAAHVAGIELGLTVLGGRITASPAPVGVANGTIGALALAVGEAQRHRRWQRFKACAGCEWVFYDKSKNGSGRWCSMSACGGRAKVAAFRARARPSRS